MKMGTIICKEHEGEKSYLRQEAESSVSLADNEQWQFVVFDL